MMSIVNCGIVGLPNVGKSTIFSALTSVPAEVANYPFCTIDPNIGVVAVPDSRLDRIHSIITADKRVPAITEFVDIAGLVKGASRGEGLGNQFLSNIRNTGIIIHVVRCFDNENVVHVDGRVNPVSDIETINTELALADLQSVDKQLEKNTRHVKSTDTKNRQEAIAREKLLNMLSAHLGTGKPVRSMKLPDDDRIRIREFSLLTEKTQIYVCNVGEEDIKGTAESVQAVKNLAHVEGAELVVLCGMLEADIAVLDDPKERALFLEDSGMDESGLSRLIRKAYTALGLQTFFTAGGVENRAWTFKNGATAPQCAGIIHSDFERGFIKADVYHCDALFQYGTEAAVKSAGKLRMEGKEYVVQDGDIMHFKFNV